MAAAATEEVNFDDARCRRVGLSAASRLGRPATISRIARPADSGRLSLRHRRRLLRSRRRRRRRRRRVGRRHQRVVAPLVVARKRTPNVAGYKAALAPLKIKLRACKTCACLRRRL